MSTYTRPSTRSAGSLPAIISLSLLLAACGTGIREKIVVQYVPQPVRLSDALVNELKASCPMPHYVPPPEELELESQYNELVVLPAFDGHEACYQAILTVLLWNEAPLPE